MDIGGATENNQHSIIIWGGCIDFIVVVRTEMYHRIKDKNIKMTLYNQGCRLDLTRFSFLGGGTGCFVCQPHILGFAFVQVFSRLLKVLFGKRGSIFSLCQIYSGLRRVGSRYTPRLCLPRSREAASSTEQALIGGIR